MYISVKHEVNKQFRRKMSQYLSGNRKLFWKEVSKVKGESCSKIKDENGRMTLEEGEVRRIWKDYFEGL